MSKCMLNFNMKLEIDVFCNLLISFFVNVNFEIFKYIYGFMIFF